MREHSRKVEYKDEYNIKHSIVTCAAWNQFMTTIVSTKPTEYPRNALLKYWLCFPLDTSNRKANATKIPKGKINTKLCKFIKKNYLNEAPLNTLASYKLKKFTLK